MCRGYPETRQRGGHRGMWHISPIGDGIGANELRQMTLRNQPWMPGLSIYKLWALNPMNPESSTLLAARSFMFVCIRTSLKQPFNFLFGIFFFRKFDLKFGEFSNGGNSECWKAKQLPITVEVYGACISPDLLIASCILVQMLGCFATCTCSQRGLESCMRSPRILHNLYQDFRLCINFAGKL